MDDGNEIMITNQSIIMSKIYMIREQKVILDF